MVKFPNLMTLELANMPAKVLPIIFGPEGPEIPGGRALLLIQEAKEPESSSTMGGCLNDFP